MTSIVEMLEQAQAIVLDDEDGQPLRLIFEQPCSSEAIDALERSISIRLPLELKQLLEYSNGMSLFGLRIMPLNELSFFPSSHMIAFHNWGNGDFDCISIDSSELSGTILFMNHEPDVTVRISDSLNTWIRDAIEEISTKGALLHPSDYRHRSEAGMYSSVLRSLCGIDCELMKG